MKNKKGFTLIELLVTLAILAIVILIAVPTVMSLVAEARKRAFDTEIRSIMTNIRDRFATDNVNYDEKDRKAFEYHYEDNPLHLEGEELIYDIKTDNHGNIICMEIANKSFQFTYSGPGVGKNDELNIIERENDFEPKCE